MNQGAIFNSFFLLAALENSIIHSQIRSKQFSADIIDSVVGRLDEVVIPYHKSTTQLRKIEKQVEKIVLRRAEIRETLSFIIHEIDLFLRNESTFNLAELFKWKPSIDEYRGRPAFLGGRKSFLAFNQRSTDIVKDVLLPKYYDPSVDNTAKLYNEVCRVVSVGELVKEGVLQLDTGDEIGRLNYGTGQIPFVRTSDFGSWEVKREAKQGVSEEVYDIWSKKQDVKPNDILLVRDGTYLVGTSVLVQEQDLPLLYCGGIIKIRSLKPDILPPSLLFTLLNTPFARRQMRNKQFTRDVIDTLGRRITEILLPIPVDNNIQSQIAVSMSKLLSERISLRVSLQNISQNLYSVPIHIPNDC